MDEEQKCQNLRNVIQDEKRLNDYLAWAKTKTESGSYEKTQKFIELLVPHEQYNNAVGSLRKVNLDQIMSAMVESELVKNPNSLWGKFKMWFNLHTQHFPYRTEGYSFNKIGKDQYEVFLCKYGMSDLFELPGDE